MVDGPPYPLCRVTRIAGVPLRVQGEVNVPQLTGGLVCNNKVAEMNKTRTLTFWLAKVVLRLIMFLPDQKILQLLDATQ